MRMSGTTVEIVTKASPRSVEDTMARLTTTLADRGLTLFAVTDELASPYGLTEELADRLRAIDGITDAVVNR